MTRDRTAITGSTAATARPRIQTVAMEMPEQWLETVLRRRAEEKSVVRVLSKTADRVVPPGDNYSSDISRITMDVVLGSGAIAKRSVIAKCVPGTQLRAKHTAESGVFTKEIKMFGSILPTMEKLMEEEGDTSGPLWGECYYAKPNDMLLLQDLKVLGYKMANRRECLDMQHAKFVLKNLAKFHSLSMIAASKGTLDTLEFSKNLFSTNTENMSSYFDTSFTTFADVIETTWEPEWKVYGDKIRALRGHSIELINEMFDASAKKFNVLNHGDCWVNNIMFKYEDDVTGDKPILKSVRFVDFQMVYYDSFAYDLQYFLTTSIKNELRENHYRDLLEYYHAHLSYYLNQFHYPGEVPTLEEVQAEFDKRFLFGFMVAVIMVPFVSVDPEDALDLENLLEKWEKNREPMVNAKPYLSKKCAAGMKSIIKECGWAGAFDRFDISS